MRRNKGSVLASPRPVQWMDERSVNESSTNRCMICVNGAAAQVRLSFGSDAGARLSSSLRPLCAVCLLSASLPACRNVRARSNPDPACNRSACSGMRACRSSKLYRREVSKSCTDAAAATEEDLGLQIHHNLAVRAANRRRLGSGAARPTFGRTPVCTVLS